MCILFLAINQHHHYPLIICANRDEFHQRPTQAAHFWQDIPQMLAGKDLQAGGSWLGVNRSGDFAAITNFRTGSGNAADIKSRGDLVRLALQSDSPINESWLQQHSVEYNPFNFIYGSAKEMFCYNSAKQQQTILENGFHAISNGSIDDVWPKMAKGEKRLEALVQSSEIIDVKNLFAILRDTSQATADELPNTGISYKWEKMLSSIFIYSDDYGTRSSSIIMQDSLGVINFTEAEYDKQGSEVNLNCFTIPIERK